MALVGCGGSGIAENVSVVPSPVRIVRHHGIHRIKHVVVIMQENRSFDSYFGTFPGADGLPAEDGHFSVCVPDPQRKPCQYPYHNPEQVNGGSQHNDSPPGRTSTAVARTASSRPPSAPAAGLAA